jgi:hypothetical protein
MLTSTYVPDNSTSSKQDQLLEELQKKADLTETQPISGNVEACLAQYEYSGDLGSLDAQLNIADPCATGSAVFQVSGTWKGKMRKNKGLRRIK